MINLLDHFFKKLPILFLALFIVGFLAMFYLRFFGYIFMMAFAIIGALIYLALKARPDNDVIDKFEINRFFICLHISFFIMLGWSFIFLLNVFLSKPIWYYIIISICSGLIALEIMLVKSNLQGLICLTKILILGLSISGSNQILFAGIGGPDSYMFIYNLLIPLIEIGHLSFGGIYSYFAGHIYSVCISSLILSDDPEKVYHYIGSLFGTISSLFVFLIGTKFVGLRCGLFSALLSQTSSFLVNWQSHPFQATYALPFAVIIYYITVSLSQTKNIKYIILFVIISFTLIICHPHTSAVVLLLIILVLFSEILYKGGREIQQWGRNTRGLLEFYLISVLAYWIFYSMLFNRFVNIIYIYGKALSELTLIKPLKFDILPLDTIFVNTLGISILIMLSIIGFMYIITKIHFFESMVIITTVILSLFLVLGTFMGLEFFEPQRIMTYLQQFCLIFLAAYGIDFLLRKGIVLDESLQSAYNGPLIVAMENNPDSTFKDENLGNLSKMTSKGRNKMKNQNIVFTLLIISLTICLTFFSISSTIAGYETSLFINDQPYLKLYTTQQEIRVEEWVSLANPQNKSNVYISRSFYKYVHPDINNSNNVFNKMPIKNDSTIDFTVMEPGSLIVGSEFDYITGFFIDVKSGRFGHTSYLRLNRTSKNNLSKIYKCYDNSLLQVHFI